eukprot:4627335-Amphidinium_carterae.3
MDDNIHTIHTMAHEGKTIESQYITADNGLEVDQQCELPMSLHKWHIEDNDAVMGKRLVKNATDNGTHRTMYVEKYVGTDSLDNVYVDFIDNQ